jgi:methionyl-tRNA formyltransferase
MVAGEPLRIVFFGTPEFAVPSLDAILASRHRVVGVVTQPDRPRGRGQKVTDGPVKARAVARRLTLLQPERLKTPEFLDALIALHADLGVVAAYGKILNDPVLAAPRLGLINVHASLLPRYRGAAPVHRAIIAGEHETGVTIMRVVKALDAGPMMASVVRAIGPNETSVDVEHALARTGADLLMDTIDRLADGAAAETPQDESVATYAHRLTTGDGAIDWHWPAERVHNLIRGLHPWPHASTHLHSRRFILLRSRASADPHASDADPGTILEASGDQLRVATGRGTLHVLEIQAEGKRPMTTREFLAGHRFAPGDRFAPPA